MIFSILCNTEKNCSFTTASSFSRTRAEEDGLSLSLLSGRPGTSRRETYTQLELSSGGDCDRDLWRRRGRESAARTTERSVKTTFIFLSFPFVRLGGSQCKKKKRERVDKIRQGSESIELASICLLVRAICSGAIENVKPPRILYY